MSNNGGADYENETQLSEIWWWCRSCDIDFQDPYAEEQDGVVYALCECGRQYERDLAEVTA